MNYLLYWPTWLQVVFIIAVFSGLSILGLYSVRRLVPVERLKQEPRGRRVHFWCDRCLLWAFARIRDRRSVGTLRPS
jgi:hypothetical protein